MVQNENRGLVGGTGRVKPVEIVRRSRWTVESFCVVLFGGKRVRGIHSDPWPTGITGSPPEFDGSFAAGAQYSGRNSFKSNRRQL
jgi:hypothetical protein